MNDAFKKFDLSGKTAFVTGGGSGLGYFMARGLARSGANVMIIGRREDVLKESALKIAAESGGNEVLYHSMDLADRQSLQEGAEHAIKTLGGVDIFVGNAGVETMELIENHKDETNDWMFQVNVFANMALVKHFSPHMRKNKWGRIIFSSSMISKVSSAEEGFGCYSAVKGALNAYMRDASVELGHDNITVNCILIGVFMTEMLRGVFDSHGAAPQTIQDLIDMHAIGRLGEEEEMEGITQFLASDAAAYMTGAEIPFDGGATIMMRPHQRSE